MDRTALVGALALIAAPLHAQWIVQESHTTASLRGISSVDGKFAWASGAMGTVLRTNNGGAVWQACAVPPGAATLDFRAIQAFDASTAIVMSAGPGAQSRLYQTTDGCRSWTLLLTNQDRVGFWDALRFFDREHGMLLGDPVNGQFVVLRTADGGATWQRVPGAAADEASGQGAFAASNSSLLLSSPADWSFCTGGAAGPHVWRAAMEPYSGQGNAGPLAHSDSSEELISESKGDSVGCFSLAEHAHTVVAVGGDYSHPERNEDNAWTTAAEPDNAAAQAETKRHPMFRFSPARTGPGGYRSSVEYDDAARAWIAVGPTGTDISTDDALHWRALKPKAGAAADLDRGWNALSLPFVVGPNGRIARLHSDIRQFASPAY